MSRKEQKTATKPWITKGIRKSIQIKNYLKKKSCKTKDSTKKAELDAKHKKYKKLLKNLTRKSKDSHYKTFFNENKNNALKIREGIKKIKNIKPTNKSKTINLDINGNLTTDKIKIAKEFNTFFNTIPAKIDSKIVPTNYSFLDTLKNPNINTIFLSPTTTDEIETTIKYFNERKATGPNNIPTKILKSVKKPLAMPLCELINLVFVTGNNFRNNFLTF